MTKVHFGISGLFMSIVEIAIGILLLIDPLGFTSGIIAALGAVLAVMGISQISGYFRDDAEDAAAGKKLAKGILLTILGIFCVFKSEWLIATFPVITALYGILTLIVGVIKLQNAVDMARLKQEYWFVALVGALLTLLVAALIVFNPFTSAAVLWVFIGVAMIVEAAVDIVTFAFIRRS